MAEQYYQDVSQGTVSSYSFGRLTHLLGAGISAALIVGAAYWTFTIVTRDATQIPVVQASSGPMRVAPNNPGGQTAENMDLAVTKIPAAPTEDRVDTVTLAPRAPALKPEDEPVAKLAQTATLSTTSDRDAQAVTAEPDVLDIDAIADSLVEGVTPLGQVAPEPVTANVTQGNIEDALRMALSEDSVTNVSFRANTGLVASLRPRPRPSQATFGTVPQPVVAAAAAAPTLRSADIPAGTPLVQLGAYDDDATAKAEWQRLSQVLSPLLSDRPRVIERSQSGGRTFYRLRAAGFDDLNDARRFCSAVTNKTPCIPVIAR